MQEENPCYEEITNICVNACGTEFCMLWGLEFPAKLEGLDAAKLLVPGATCNSLVIFSHMGKDFKYLNIATECAVHRDNWLLYDNWLQVNIFKELQL